MHLLRQVFFAEGKIKRTGVLFPIQLTQSYKHAHQSVINKPYPYLRTKNMSNIHQLAKYILHSCHFTFGKIIEYP